MSIWSNLLVTYESIHNASGIKTSSENFDIGSVLLPLFHTIVEVSIYVTLSEEGELINIESNKQNKRKVIIPCSEGSMGRSSSKICAHPLIDQLQYFDRKISKERVDNYLQQLKSWMGDNPYLTAIYKYVSKHNVAQDAQKYEINLLEKNDKGQYKSAKEGVSFAVQVRGTNNPHVEDRPDLRERWIQHEKSELGKNCQGLDIFGQPLYHITTNFPKKIIPNAANAKLFSANDKDNFTFRGRFKDSKEALQIDVLTSQKIYVTLKWLISNNGSSSDSQTIVIWAVDNPSQQIENPESNSFEFFNALCLDEDEHDYVGEALNKTDSNYAEHFIKLLRGYGNANVLKHHRKRIIVAILDVPVNGRMSVVFYRELDKNEYIEDLLNWHIDSSWEFSYYDEKRQKEVSYYGAPSYEDIINCAYPGRIDEKSKSSDSYNKFVKQAKKQLIECIFGNRPLPKYLLASAFHKVTRPLAYKNKKDQDNRDNLRTRKSNYPQNNLWNKDFEVACSLWKKHFIDQERQTELNDNSNNKEYELMELDVKRTDRDYLFGRLLSLADIFEEQALKQRGKAGTRPTNAVKLMSTYIAKPNSTWFTLCKRLVPYMKADQEDAYFFQNRVDEVIALFKPGAFEDNSSLSPLFLLGFSTQRRYIQQEREKAKAATSSKE